MILPVPEKLKKKIVPVSQEVFYCIYCGSMLYIQRVMWILDVNTCQLTPLPWLLWCELKMNTWYWSTDFTEWERKCPSQTLVAGLQALLAPDTFLYLPAALHIHSAFEGKWPSPCTGKSWR